jgi:hypothetical protein
MCQGCRTGQVDQGEPLFFIANLSNKKISTLKRYNIVTNFTIINQKIYTDDLRINTVKLLKKQ